MTNSVYFDPGVGGDGSTVTDDSNALTGLGNGGHRTRFVPALAQMVAVAQYMVALANQATKGIWQPARLATTANHALSGLAAIDGVTPVAGDRILVKAQTTGSQNGIYVAAAGAWTRSTDADANSEVTSGKVIVVNEGTLAADTLWRLTTDGAIVVGTTSLTFVNITTGYALLASPAFTGNPTGPTPAQGDNDTSLATTAFVQAAGIHFQAGIGTVINANTSLTLTQLNHWFDVTATGLTIGLPAIAGVLPGSTYTFKCDYDFTIDPNAAETIRDSKALSTGSATLTVSAGEIIQIAANTSEWVVTNRGMPKDAPQFTGDAGFISTGAIKIPVGTTAQRPANGAGKIRYNSTLTKFEGNNGSAWSGIGGGATGGGADQVFVENDQTVTADYTITTNRNAHSVGPISINTGITVTIPTGSIWLID